MIRTTTGTADESAAQIQLGQLEALFAAKKSSLNLEQAFGALSGKTIPAKTIMAEVQGWVDEAKRTTSEATHAKYQAISHSMLRALRATDTGPLLGDVTTDRLRDHLHTRLNQTSPATANLERKVLRVFFKRAVDNGSLKVNPIAPIKHFKSARKVRRRDFTAEEMKAIYNSALGDFWRYMILGGFYTGMRLGDLTTLRIDEVDFKAGMINREMDKIEGRFIHIPIVPILTAAIRKQIGVRKIGFVWPEMAHKYEKSGAGWFSNQFYAILTKAGIVEERKNHQAKKNGRASTREASKVSFHSLRHTFVSMLKKTGASQTIAKELAGHSTDAISNLYTHTSPEALTHAVNQLPDFVK